MSFERRIVDVLIFIAITGAVAAGVVGLVLNYSQISGNDTALEVKTLQSIKATPKVKYIPVKSRNSTIADISNAVLTPRAKKPVVITI